MLGLTRNYQRLLGYLRGVKHLTVLSNVRLENKKDTGNAIKNFAAVHDKPTIIRELQMREQACIQCETTEQLTKTENKRM